MQEIMTSFSIVAPMPFLTTRSKKLELCTPKDFELRKYNLRLTHTGTSTNAISLTRSQGGRRETNEHFGGNQ